MSPEDAEATAKMMEGEAAFGHGHNEAALAAYAAALKLDPKLYAAWKSMDFAPRQSLFEQVQCLLALRRQVRPRLFQRGRLRRRCSHSQPQCHDILHIVIAAFSELKAWYIT